MLIRVLDKPDAEFSPKLSFYPKLNTWTHMPHFQTLTGVLEIEVGIAASILIL